MGVPWVGALGGIYIVASEFIRTWAQTEQSVLWVNSWKAPSKLHWWVGGGLRSHWLEDKRFRRSFLRACESIQSNQNNAGRPLANSRRGSRFNFTFQDSIQLWFMLNIQFWCLNIHRMSILVKSTLMMGPSYIYGIVVGPPFRSFDMPNWGFTTFTRFYTWTFVWLICKHTYMIYMIALFVACERQGGWFLQRFGLEDSFGCYSDTFLFAPTSRMI